MTKLTAEMTAVELLHAHAALLAKLAEIEAELVKRGFPVAAK